MSGCPEPEVLEALARGEPVDPALEQHVADCAQCAAALANIAENNALLAELVGGPALGAELGYAAVDAVPGYRVQGEIHRGGQGVVYRALQESTHRQVALKVLLHGALASPERQRRFEREIELVATLAHPNIVTVFDSGCMKDGRHWLGMEFVEGLTLDRFVQSRVAGEEPWKTADTLRLFARIAHAVNYAHQRGVIHRDLKPGNILVDERGEPRVLDFGLAKTIQDDKTSAASALTLSQEFVGTLAYSSPEQVRGASADVDTRTDVYSLGVILYELLTGRSPYPEAEHMADLVHAIAEVDPKRPSSRTGRAKRGLEPNETRLARVGADLDTIVLRALAKDPSRRYQSAGDLAADVERYLAGEPIDARRDSTWYLVRKMVARHKVPVGALALLFVTVVGAAIALAALWHKSVLAGERATLEARDAGEVSEFLVELFGAVDPLSARGNEVRARDILDSAVERIDERLVEQPEIRSRLLERMGQSYANLGLYREAAPLLERALAIRRAIHGEGSSSVATAAVNLAQMRRLAGLGGSLELVREGLEIQRARLGDGSAEVAHTMIELASALSAENDHEEAIAACEETQDLIESLEGDTRELRASLLAAWAHTNFMLRNYETSEAQARDALALQRELDDDSHPRMVLILNTLAVNLRNLKKHGEAEDVYQELLPLAARLYGEESDRFALLHTNRARNLEALGRTEEAEASYRRALAILQRAVHEGNPHLVTCQGNLAGLLMRGGEYEEARTLYLRVLPTMRADLGDLDSRVIYTTQNLGLCHYALGELAQAKEVLREAHGLAVEQGRSSSRILTCRLFLGSVLARDEAGRDEAQTIFEWGTREAPKVTKFPHLGAHARLGLGRLALARGDHDEAIEHLQAALAVDIEAEPHSWLHAAAKSALGEALRAHGRLAESEDLMLAGYTELADLLGPTHIETLDARDRIVAVYEATGRAVEAAALRDR